MDRNAPCVSIGDFPHDTQKAGFRPTLVVTPKQILVSPSLLINPLLFSLVAAIFLFTKHNNYLYIIVWETPSFFEFFYHISHLFSSVVLKIGRNESNLREFKMRNWAFRYKSWSVVLSLSDIWMLWSSLLLLNGAATKMNGGRGWGRYSCCVLDLAPVWTSWWSIVVIYPSLLSSCLVHITKSSWVWWYSSFKPKQMRWQNWQWAWKIKPNSNIIPRISAFPTHGAHKGHQIKSQNGNLKVEMPMVGKMMLVWDFLCSFNLTYFQTSKHRQGSLSLSLSAHFSKSDKIMYFAISHVKIWTFLCKSWIN